MQNGQLNPAYNLQASTNKQYPTNYILAHTTANNTTSKDHVIDSIKNYNETPEKINADTGYDTEENDTYLENKEFTADIKYNYFHKEQLVKKNGKINPFHPNEFYYNKEADTYYYPIRQAITPVRIYKKKTKNGFQQGIHSSQTQNRKGCSLRSLCHQSKYNHIIKRNYNLIRLKA